MDKHVRKHLRQTELQKNENWNFARFYKAHLLSDFRKEVRTSSRIFFFEL